MFRSPIVFNAYEGKEGGRPDPAHRAGGSSWTSATCARSAPRTRGTTRSSSGARVGDREVEGCDFLHLDDSGSVDELVVMVRPLTGAHALAEEMEKQLAAAQEGISS